MKIALICLLAGGLLSGVFSGQLLAIENKKVLVVYYSKSGNTKAIAEMIQGRTGGEIYEIETVKAYTRERPAAADIPKEERETGHLPELKGSPPNLDDYDLIIIGSPIWWYTLATPVMAFLRDTDFSGKKIAGFYTYSGDGRHFESDLRQQAKNGSVVESIGFRGTYDTGCGQEPDGQAYQEQRRDDINKRLEVWLEKIMK